MFTYSLLGKAFEKQIKTIEDQGEKYIKALEEHRNQIAKHSNEKQSFKTKKLEELANKRIDEIQDLNKNIDSNN